MIELSAVTEEEIEAGFISEYILLDSMIDDLLDHGELSKEWVTKLCRSMYTVGWGAGMDSLAVRVDELEKLEDEEGDLK